MNVRRIITNKRFVTIGVLLILVVGATMIILNNEPQKQSVSTTPQKGSNSASSSAGSVSKAVDSSTQPLGSSGQQNLLPPVGNFVSNHRPNLSGSPAPNTLQSVCITTPAVNCNITFTKDNVTKSLGTKVTDNEGVAYWTWKLQDVGLTEGTWQVKALASMSEKTKSAKDAQALVVLP
ncbi:MAG TPA: hypothetical protein VJJ78_03935 [Candidatus Saccharimonadales bacterium]|nr:hypothetical protein [Candidatus Saccharimonadales bacterium]